MDSLYHYFVVKQNGQGHPNLFLGEHPISNPPIINIPEIRQTHLR